MSKTKHIRGNGYKSSINIWRLILHIKIYIILLTCIIIDSTYIKDEQTTENLVMNSLKIDKKVLVDSNRIWTEIGKTVEKVEWIGFRLLHPAILIQTRLPSSPMCSRASEYTHLGQCAYPIKTDRSSWVANTRNQVLRVPAWLKGSKRQAFYPSYDRTLGFAFFANLPSENEGKDALREYAELGYIDNKTDHIGVSLSLRTRDNKASVSLINRFWIERSGAVSQQCLVHSLLVKSWTYNILINLLSAPCFVLLLMSFFKRDIFSFILSCTGLAYWASNIVLEHQLAVDMDIIYTIRHDSSVPIANHRVIWWRHFFSVVCVLFMFITFAQIIELLVITKTFHKHLKRLRNTFQAIMRHSFIIVALSCSAYYSSSAENSLILFLTYPSGRFDSGSVKISKSSYENQESLENTNWYKRLSLDEEIGSKNISNLQNNLNHIMSLKQSVLDSSNSCSIEQINVLRNNFSPYCSYNYGHWYQNNIVPRKNAQTKEESTAKLAYSELEYFLNLVSKKTNKINIQATRFINTSNLELSHLIKNRHHTTTSENESIFSDILVNILNYILYTYLVAHISCVATDSSENQIEENNWQLEYTPKDRYQDVYSRFVHRNKDENSVSEEQSISSLEKEKSKILAEWVGEEVVPRGFKINATPNELRRFLLSNFGLGTRNVTDTTLVDFQNSICLLEYDTVGALYLTHNFVGSKLINLKKVNRNLCQDVMRLIVEALHTISNLSNVLQIDHKY